MELLFAFPYYFAISVTMRGNETDVDFKGLRATNRCLDSGPFCTSNFFCKL
jgi:hypothetical protein